MEKWALVTGASAGIGRELADVLAGNGFSLVLVARSQPRLEASAAELESRHKIHVKVLPRDLSQPNAAASITIPIKAAKTCWLATKSCSGAE